jgi:ribose transport system ATP-binding protein
VLSLKHISKSYPGVQALQDVSVDFLPGEIHALLGENGAGKSTLIKIISGYHRQDEGTVFLNDEPFAPRNTHEAFVKGVHTVYQDLQVIPLASIAENIMLDKLTTRGATGVLDWKELNRRARKYLDIVGLKIDPTTQIGRVSVAQRQLIVIAKAISSDLKILLLDEPTASLTENDAQYLFKVMNQLRDRGVIVIFVSHVLEEVLQVADRITVLRDGKHIVTDEKTNLDRKAIVQHMIGRAETTKRFGTLEVDTSKKVLEVRNLTREKGAQDITFDLYEGEILGFYGLVGAGRTELAKILIGHDRYDSGEIIIRGQKARIRSISDAISRYGMGYVTEDRHRDGLIMNHSLKTNLTITVWSDIARLFNYVPDKKEEAVAWKQVDNLEIRTYGLQQKAGNLSGGNQQKVNVGKWLAADSDILIIDEPTVGVDVGAKEYFVRLIWELARNGKSIILISSDMPEIIKLASRILVFSSNRIVGEVDNQSKNYEAVSKQIGEHIEEFQVRAT